MSDVSLIHLIHKENGPNAFTTFLSSYLDHKGRFPHQLSLLFKGFESSDEIQQLTGTNVPIHLGLDTVQKTLRGEPIEWVAVPDRGYDLGSYYLAASATQFSAVQAELMVFTNSFSRPIHPGWLELLVQAARQEKVGLSGATGSLEGVGDAPFPNPHMRTNAFCIRRDLLLSLDFCEPATKLEANLLEAGPNSLTKRVLRQDLRVVVVSSNGCYDVAFSQHSRTFRWGNQDQLLVADNRTDHYANGNPELRRYLQNLAWGALESA